MNATLLRSYNASKVTGGHWGEERLLIVKKSKEAKDAIMSLRRGRSQEWVPPITAQENKADLH